ncbi:MAG: zinc ribbon domain-containing protein [Canibacter sp.]
MKASPMQQQRLLTLQDLDTQAARVRRKLQQLPERQEAADLETAMSERRPAFKEAQRKKEELETEIARLESDLEMMRERKRRDEARLTGSVSSKDASALQDEIDTLNRRAEVLEERELEFMEELEGATEIYDSRAKELEEIEQRRQKARDKIESAEEQAHTELNAVLHERGNVAAEITSELREVYERLRERTGIGAARLRGNVSAASNMSLGPAELRGLLMTPEDELIFCPHTGAILVRESTE